MEYQIPVILKAIVDEQLPEDEGMTLIKDYISLAKRMKAVGTPAQA